MLSKFFGGRDREVEELFSRFYHPMCRLAFVILRDAAGAEEVVMDAFLKAFAGWRRIGGMDRPDLYVRRAVINGCNSRLRRRSLETRTAAQWTEGVWMDRERDHSVLDAVKDLPRRQRMCVVLRYFEDLSEAEMADVMGCSEGTIKSQLFKARSKLREVLEATESVRGESHA